MASTAVKNNNADALVLRAQQDPKWFLEDVLQLKRLPKDEIDATGRGLWELDAWQEELAEAVADVWRSIKGWPTKINHKGISWITMRSMHGPGKTFGIAMIAHLFNFCFPGRIYVTAPKFKQVTTQFFPEFRKITGRAVDWYKQLIDVGTTKITWCGDPDWFVMADSAAQPENMAGKHNDYVLVLVDEATGVPETLWPVIESVLSVGKILILIAISNPTKQQGTFADSHLKESLSNDYFRFHVSIDKTRRVKKEWIERMERKYGQGSPVVKVRCYGEFPGSSPNQVIALEWIQSARDREVDAFLGDGSQPHLRISVDCGAGGENETVITACRHFNSLMVGLKQEAKSFTLATATIETAKAAIEMFERFKGRKDEDDFVVDSLGVGVGVAGVLIAKGYRVVTYQGGSESDDKARWRNRRVQSAMALRDDFRDGTIALLDTFIEDKADWDDFDAQMCSLQHPPGTDRVDDLITKQEMVRQGIVSPDRADSLVMQRATQQPTMIPKNMPTEQGHNAVEVIESDILSGLLT